MLEPLAVLAGPTASGKTQLAIDLAERIGAEIVSADSQQVYRAFDIGTAKPSAAQLARVRHHLISILEPSDRMDAARYGREASTVIAEIRSRGKVPLVVGGTGLYLRALVFGVMEGPGRDEAFREGLERRATAEGREVLHAELTAVDPTAAARIEKRDLVRIIRALEIHHVTGRAASELRAEHAFAQPRHRVWGRLLGIPRDELYRRINGRAEQMFAAGLVEETRRLIAEGYGEATPMASIGYAEARRVVAGEWTVEKAIAELAQTTRHYAKRQLTWFRRDPWLEPIRQPDAAILASEWAEFIRARSAISDPAA